MSVDLILDNGKAIAALLGTAADAAVLATARDIVQDAQGVAPVKTGCLRASIYIQADGEDTYAEASADAASRNPKAKILPELDGRQPREAFVGVAAGHGEFLELGTPKMAAQPFLTPAADAGREALPRHMAEEFQSVTL